MNCVLDASVILKWFLEEDGTDRAIALKESYVKGEIDLIEPDLLLYEVANALRFQKKITHQDIDDALQGLFDLQIAFVAPRLSSLKTANLLAIEEGITVYDAYYVALAMATDSHFITADGKLLNKLAHHSLVRLL